MACSHTFSGVPFHQQHDGVPSTKSTEEVTGKNLEAGTPDRKRANGTQPRSSITAQVPAFLIIYLLSAPEAE
jgi:hypothetical protein